MTLSPTVSAWKARQPNGEIPFKELQEIPNTFDVDLRGPCRFMPEAARSFNAMREDMHEEIGLWLQPSRTYRTLADQKAKYAAYVARGKTPPIVAVPGTSNHGEALAGDMGFGTYTDPRFVWLARHADEYGWHNNDASGEPWHWDYEGDYDKSRFNFQEDEDMGYAEFKEGVKRRNAGKPQPADEGDERFGWNLADDIIRAKELPKAGEPGPHSHTGEVTVS